VVSTVTMLWTDCEIVVPFPVRATRLLFFKLFILALTLAQLPIHIEPRVLGPGRKFDHSVLSVRSLRMTGVVPLNPLLPPPIC
jgi:hypothetical protein